MARLKEMYKEKLAPQLLKELNCKNVMEVPRVEKVVVNIGLGEAIQNPKLLDSAVEELSKITGQKAIITRAKNSIATFKLREDMPIGCCVTLRRDRAYEFLERLINVALPRVRDFRGVSEKFDGKGNYTLGVKEQIIFPEISIDKVNNISGMNITFVTSANTDEEGYELLRAFGMPFKNTNSN